MDGLRAFACLTVFLANFHHSMGMTVGGRLGPFDLATFAESGIGVLMLIVMSGGLLSLPFWQHLERSTSVPLGSFTLRRAARIVPAYYACLLLFLLATNSPPPAFDIWTHFLFVNNLFDRSFYSVSPHFWTMGMFVQLYVVLPLTFLGLRRVTTRWSTAASLIAAASAGAYLVHAELMASRQDWMPLIGYSDIESSALRRSTLAHVPHFLWGVLGGLALLVACRSTDSSRRRRVTWDAVFWTSAAALIAVSSAPVMASLELPYGRYLLPWMPFFAVTTMVSAPFAASGRRILEAAPVRWLGRISYGIYIYHMLCMQVVRHVTAAVSFDSPGMKLLFAFVSLSLTVAVAAASYFWLERSLVSATRRASSAASQPAST